MKNLNREHWNEQHQVLQNVLRSGDHRAALDVFLPHHAMVHAAEMSNAGLWSFEDEIWQDAGDDLIRRISGEHSIAWNLWHIARIEDVTMSRLVAGCPQLVDQDGWRDRLKVPFRHAGNAMSDADMQRLSAEIDLAALRAYRIAVGRRTREIVQQLQPGDLKQKVDPARLQQVVDDGAVPAAAHEIIDYWGSRTLAGLLLMPATRHNFLHLNEALRLKHKRV